MIANTSLTVGEFVLTSGYNTSGDVGSNNYEIVAAGTGTADGGLFIDLANGLQAKGLFPGGVHNVKQWGAIGDGVANDTVKIQACIDYAASIVGVRVDLPTGTYLHTSTIVIPDAVAGVNFLTLSGGGWSSSLKAGAAMTAQLSVLGGSCNLNNFLLDGNNLADTGITQNVAATDPPTVYDRIRFQSTLAAGFKCISGDGYIVSRCFFINCIIGIWNESGGKNCSITQNYILGSSGVLLQSNLSAHEGSRVTDNTILASLPGNYGIKCLGVLEVIIAHNIIDQVKGVGINIDGSDANKYIQITDNWIGGTGSVGILGVLNTRQVMIRGNVLVGWTSYHIQIDTGVVQFTISDNDMDATGTANILIGAGSVQNKINNNIMSCAVNSVRCTNNTSQTVFSFNNMAQPVISASTQDTFYFNDGFVTENIGSSNIASGSTSVTIAHGLTVLPVVANFNIQPTAITTNAPGLITVQNITSTTFDVIVRNDPGASGFPFAWSARSSF
jgi:hypothetical protein